eukprot:5245501-Pyramimonas_sp.AAC.1
MERHFLPPPLPPLPLCPPSFPRLAPSPRAEETQARCEARGLIINSPALRSARSAPCFCRTAPW